MLTKEIKEKIKTLSLQTNNEVCGLLTINGSIIPCRNISSNPKQHFVISPLDYLKAAQKGQISYVYHSHNANPEFSEFDKLNLYNQKLRGIMYCKEKDSFRVFLPESYNNKYVGKSFEIGVSDCFSLVTDYYKNELNIKLPKIERGEGWYLKNPSLIKNNVPATFRKISLSEAKKDNILIFDMLKNENPCHLGIYLSNDMLLHHPRHRLSTIELLNESLKNKIIYALELTT